MRIELLSAADLLGMSPRECATRESKIELVRWSRALLLLSHAPLAVARPMVALLGRRRPYVFERNLQRWPDGRWYLVDRGYEEFEGVVFDEERLRSIGVHDWTRTRWQRVAFADGCLPLIDDSFAHGSIATKAGLRELAHLLDKVAAEVAIKPKGGA